MPPGFNSADKPHKERPPYFGRRGGHKVLGDLASLQRVAAETATATEDTVRPARAGSNSQGLRVSAYEEIAGNQFGGSDVDETLLEALTDYVKRQRKRLGLSEESKAS